MTEKKLQDYNVLSDVSESGRKRPWREKKMANMLLSAAYESVNERKAERLRNCATYVSFVTQENGKKKLHDANFCRVRLCPMCAWRRTMKIFSHTQKIVNALNQKQDYKYIFLTLTVRNCRPEELDETVTHMMDSFHRLIKYAPFARAVKGWYRGLEITHNVQEDTYHPHFHLVCVVTKSYFTDKTYLSQAAWTELWEKAARLDYTPICDVRRVKGNTAAAIAEAAKYTVKDSDYILPNDWDMTVDTVRLLDKVLANRRLVAYGGVMKDAHRKLNLDDEVDGDLTHIDQDAVKEAKENMALTCYCWHTGYRQYIEN